MIMRSDESSPSACPSLALLSALSVGRLRGGVRDAVERHLQDCEFCLAELRFCENETDPLILGCGSRPRPEAWARASSRRELATAVLGPGR